MYGIGVLLNTLMGNQGTVEAVKQCLGEKINSILINDKEIVFKFENNKKLIIWDDGQSCCEYRHMTTSDILSEYFGSILLDFELKSAPNIADEYGEHEIQFLDVKTSVGTFQIANHNEHNGYYGGFSISAKIESL